MKSFKKIIDKLFNLKYWFLDDNYRKRLNLKCKKKIKYNIYNIK